MEFSWFVLARFVVCVFRLGELRGVLGIFVVSGCRFSFVMVILVFSLVVRLWMLSSVFWGGGVGVVGILF